MSERSRKSTKQIYEMYQIDNLKMKNVIGEEMAKHLTEQFLHLMKSININIAICDFSIKAYGRIILFESSDNLFDLSEIFISSTMQI